MSFPSEKKLPSNLKGKRKLHRLDSTEEGNVAVNLCTTDIYPHLSLFTGSEHYQSDPIYYNDNSNSNNNNNINYNSNNNNNHHHMNYHKYYTNWLQKEHRPHILPRYTPTRLPRCMYFEPYKGRGLHWSAHPDQWDYKWGK